MVSNWQSLESREGDDGRGHRIPIIQSKQRHGDPKEASLSGLRNVIKGLWTNDHELYFERFLRRVVREEVERKVQDYLSSRAWVNQTGTSRATPFELRFINKLPDIIFTQSNIIGEDKTPIQIALFDVRDQSVVNVGPLSSIKVEICALNGEFGFNGSEDWTEDDFNVNILREREGKRPLLNGDRFITLKNGVGSINKVMFTDNSRWIRSRKFRLGAKVVQPTAKEANIKEGRSEPFVVKDYRGETYKKHYPPSLNDDVWRLEQIAKDGKIHKRLSLHGIHTIKDLMRLYTTNPSSLLEKVGNIPKRSWIAIIEHAKTCVIDDNETFVYHSAEQSIGLLFNSIYVLVGVTFDGQNYRSPDTLTLNEKHLVEILKQNAYRNTDNFKSIDETSLSCLRPLACLGAGQSDATEQGLQQLNISTEQEDRQGTWAGYGQPYASTSYIDEGVENYQIYVDSVPDITDMPLNNPLNNPYAINSMKEYTKEFFSGLCIEGDSSVPYG
ncbi:Calmodulin-binding protein 60 G [Spatholobus suberectus]|nr:Calmodulin-binding protein 60 G [Spatholobus suberectus]